MIAGLDAIVAKVKPGDEVTATFCLRFDGNAFTITGTIWGSTSGDLVVGRETVRFKNGARGHLLTDLVINKPASYPEPPIRSVVLDMDGDAWQCVSAGWEDERLWACWGYSFEKSWESLTRDRGPLRVIYTPEVES